VKNGLTISVGDADWLDRLGNVGATGNVELALFATASGEHNEQYGLAKRPQQGGQTLPGSVEAALPGSRSGNVRRSVLVLGLIESLSTGGRGNSS
jgi:hypothetical protein